MKVGIRTPNLKKRLKARTTAQIKRKAKAAVNPFYGKKGMGFIRNPKKALYNKVYRKTTVSVDDLVKGGKSRPRRRKGTYSFFAIVGAVLAVLCGLIAVVDVTGVIPALIGVGLFIYGVRGMKRS